MAQRKGIILSGGSGSRLYPITIVTNKQLVPIYNKPMIYYPLATLMLADITELLIISSPDRIDLFRSLFHYAHQLGISISFAEQAAPRGIAEALIIAEEFLDGSPSALILGDNFFYGDQLENILVDSNALTSGASIFAKQVHDPTSYGVVHLQEDGKPSSIVEKPSQPTSNLAVTGLYFYDATASERASALTPSARYELEVTDLNRLYLQDGLLTVNILPESHVWYDSGTYEGLLQSSNFVADTEKKTRKMIGCIEEIAFRKNWVSQRSSEQLISQLPKGEYRDYLITVQEEIYG